MLLDKLNPIFNGGTSTRGKQHKWVEVAMVEAEDIKKQHSFEAQTQTLMCSLT